VRVSRFFAATGVRLAILQAVLLVCAFWVAGALTKFSTTYIYRHDVEARLQSEAATLAALYQSRGLGDVAAAVTSGERRRGGLEYRLVDPSGRPLAGDLPPTGAPLGLTFLDWDDARVPGRPYQDLMVDNVRLPDGSILTVGQDLTDEGKLRHALKTTLFWCGGAGAVVGLALSYLLARGVLRRVDGVVAAARAVSAGQMTVRAPRRKALLPDDIDELGGSFNAMLDEIAALIDRVRWVSTNIAHDLRTPLTHVRQKLERLRLAANDDPRVLTAARDIEGDVDELLRVFDAMLRLAEIESGPLAARFAPVDLDELAGRIADAYRPDIEASGRALSTSLTPATAQGDADLIGQAIANLLENALRHTPAGSQVELAVETWEGRPRLRVSDDGPGIPEARRQDALRHFYRLEASRTTPGSGLGLAIVAAIASRHGAAVALLDAEPGLTVLLTFPPRAGGASARVG
jgi:signal transduction histidine kinase